MFKMKEIMYNMIDKHFGVTDNLQLFLILQLPPQKAGDVPCVVM